MNAKLLMVSLVLGLAVATALPTKNLKALRTRRNSAASSGRLGIYGGKTTTIDQHNYLVGIVIDDEFSCAGAIVSDAYVLTTGDCVYDMSASDLTVVAGSNDGVNGTSFSVKKIIFNPSYSLETLGFDFALLKIKGTFTWGDDVGNVTLPSADPKNGAALVAAGWGYTSNLGALGDSSLLQGTMKYVTETKCQTYYSDYDIAFDDSMACTYNKGKVTLCDNDFGDPFTKGRVLYGLMIAAGGDFCTSSALPVIIGDVYHVVDWINDYIS